jgi:hypothetical protein
MSDICWSCGEATYHDYKDRHGIRCPSCGQKEKDDPASAKVVLEFKPPVKRVAPKSNTRSK